MVSINFSADPIYNTYIDELRKTFSEDKSTVIRRAIKTLHESPNSGQSSFLDSLSKVGLFTLLFDYQYHDFSHEIMDASILILMIPDIDVWSQQRDFQQLIVNRVTQHRWVRIFVPEVSDTHSIHRLTDRPIVVDKRYKPLLDTLAEIPDFVANKSLRVVADKKFSNDWILSTGDIFYWAPFTSEVRTLMPFAFGFKNMPKDQSAARRLHDYLGIKLRDSANFNHDVIFKMRRNLVSFV